MKKLIIILLLFLLSCSCSKYIVRNMFSKTYDSTQVENLYYDIYSQLKHHDLDSIPLQDWITTEFSVDTIQILQKVVIKNINKKTNYTFIYTKYTYPRVYFYQFVVRYAGKDK
jgi:hypothetical protein